jgi:hypothetical protein
MPPKYPELSKVRAISAEFGDYGGYVVATVLRNGRWIYKISISEDPTERERRSTTGYRKNALS